MLVDFYPPFVRIKLLTLSAHVLLENKELWRQTNQQRDNMKTCRQIDKHTRRQIQKILNTNRLTGRQADSERERETHTHTQTHTQTHTKTHTNTHTHKD